MLSRGTFRWMISDNRELSRLKNKFDNTDATRPIYHKRNKNLTQSLYVKNEFLAPSPELPSEQKNWKVPTESETKHIQVTRNG